MATSFKGELLLGAHQFGSVTLISRTSLTAPTTDTFKFALYVATATLGAATATYSTTNEVTGTGYSAGGVTVTNGNAPSTSGTTAIWTPSASFAWTTVTLATSFDAGLLYNSTQTTGGNGRAVSVHTFGATTVTAGNFTLTMPTNDASNALIRIA
jgi:hypothetical protein